MMEIEDCRKTQIKDLMIYFLVLENLIMFYF